jgi:hypothetical protein
MLIYLRSTFSLTEIVKRGLYLSGAMEYGDAMIEKAIELLEQRRQMYLHLAEDSRRLGLMHAESGWGDDARAFKKAIEIVRSVQEPKKSGRYLPSRHPAKSQKG